MVYNKSYCLHNAVMDCNRLDPPADGTVDASVTTYEAVATYSCNTGYELTGGSQTRTCQADGNWDGEQATCTSEIIMSQIFKYSIFSFTVEYL